MTRKNLLFIPALLLLFASSSYATDTLLNFPIEQAMKNGEVLAAINKNVALYWGAQPTPATAQTYGNFKTSKRTTSLGKSQQDACEWALASALIALQDRALREGGNAVVNIQSNINNHPTSSQTHYSCLVGSVMVNVALTGNAVKLAH